MSLRRTAGRERNAIICFTTTDISIQLRTLEKEKKEEGGREERNKEEREGRRKRGKGDGREGKNMSPNTTDKAFPSVKWSYSHILSFRIFLHFIFFYYKKCATTNR